LLEDKKLPQQHKGSTNTCSFVCHLKLVTCSRLETTLFDSQYHETRYQSCIMLNRYMYIASQTYYIVSIL